MPRVVALLRAINLGSQRRFPMAEVIRVVEGLGGTEVATHLATGNVCFTTDTADPEQVSARLEQAFEADRGFEVPVVVLRADDLAQVAADAEEIGAGHVGQHLVSFLRDPAPADAQELLDAIEAPGERAVVRGQVVHLLLGETVRESRLGNAAVEKHLGLATARSAQVVETMAQKWASRS